MTDLILLNTFLDIASKVNNIFALICMMGIGAFFFLRGKGKDGKEIDKTTLYVLGGLAVLLSAIGAWAHTQTPKDSKAEIERLDDENNKHKGDLKSLQDSIVAYKFKLGECNEKGQNCAGINAQLETAKATIDSLKDANAILKTELEKAGMATKLTTKGCNSIQYNFSGPYAVVYDIESKKWGYRGKSQSLQDVKFIYSGAARFSNGMAGVMNQEGKWGFIDEYFNVKIKYQYYDAWAFKAGKAKVKVKDEKGGKDENWMWINKKGEEIDNLD